MIAEQWKAFNREDYPHEWTHFFDETALAEERQQWLHDAMGWAHINRIELVINETAESVELGFKRVEDMAAFVTGSYGNLESKGNHTHTQVFPDASEPDAYFMQAAEAYLTSMGIEFTKEVHGNEVSYSFDIFADRANFQWLIEHGAMNHMANHLRQLEAFDRQFFQMQQGVNASFDQHRN
jgi:proteasome lid subunit RPN8/RPN11